MEGRAAVSQWFRPGRPEPPSEDEPESRPGEEEADSRPGEDEAD